MTDLISRADAIEAVAQQWLFEASAESPYVNDDDIGEYRKLAEELFEDVPSAEAEWIPFKKRPLTDEEKQEYPDWTYIFDCPLPDDEEEILLSNGKYVWTDTFINDGECYLDGGDDIDEGMAWMPLPKPYKGGAE